MGEGSAIRGALRRRPREGWLENAGGVTVHWTDCPNVANIDAKERLMRVD